MAKKTPINQADIEAFQKAVDGIKRLNSNKIRLAPKSPLPRRAAKKSPREPEPIYFDDTSNLDTVRSETYISHKKAGISDKTLRKLSKGQYNVEATLDLHGMTVEEAKIAVGDFLKRCLHDGIRVVLIIHGKGRHRDMPILKNKLNHWLRKINSVLAFCSASAAHGSRGAMYILLRRSSLE